MWKKKSVTGEEFVLDYFQNNMFIQDVNVIYTTNIYQFYRKSVEHCHHNKLINVISVKKEKDFEIINFTLTEQGIALILLKNKL